MTSKLRISRKKYFTILIIYTVILLIIAFIGLKILWSFAEEYEVSQIDSVIKSYLSELNSTKWNNQISDASIQLVNSFQEQSEIEKIIKDYLNAREITHTTSSIGEVMSYNLICDNQQIGKVSFSENLSAHTRFKMYPWTKVSDEFNFDFLRNELFSIELPDSYSLQVNGKDVGEEYIVQNDIPYDILSPYYSDYAGLPHKVRYEIHDLVGDIDYKVYDSSGREFEFDKSATDIQFVIPCTKEEENEMQNFMEDGFVESFIKFWGTKWVDETYPTLMKYVKMGSSLQQEMYIYTLDAATWIHTNSVVVNGLQFNYALSLGGGVYIVSESVDSTAYADYKTVVETSDVVVIVVKDSSTGEILAIDRA